MTTPTNPYLPGAQQPSEMPSSPAAAYGQPQAQPPAPKSRRGLVIALVAGAIVLLALAGGILFAGGLLGNGGLSQEAAQRACRTAIEQEGKRRAAGGDPSSGILITIKETTVEDAFETEAGWQVDGTVAYTLTSALIPQVEQAVSLSCKASGADDDVKTSVGNRS
jgi:hypothetical protein